jgi:hypothetical protein
MYRMDMRVHKHRDVGMQLRSTFWSRGLLLLLKRGLLKLGLLKRGLLKRRLLKRGLVECRLQTRRLLKHGRLRLDLLRHRRLRLAPLDRLVLIFQHFALGVAEGVPFLEEALACSV